MKTKELLFLELWNRAKSTYPQGNSKHTNAILENDFDDLMGAVINICKINSVDFAEWLKIQPLISSETANGVRWKGSFFGSKYYTSEELYDLFLNNENVLR